MKPAVCYLYSVFLAILTPVTNISLAAEDLTVAVSEDAEIAIERYPASGKHLVLLLAPEYGFRENHRVLARRLAEQHIEVWMTSIAESLFMTLGTSSIRKLDGQYVAAVIKHAYKTTGKKITVAGDSYASISVLRGIHQWQSKKQSGPYLTGAILFTPHAHAYIPSLGLPPVYVPVVSSTNVPVVIFQSENSATAGQFMTLLENLQQHRNPVYAKKLPDVISMFYSNPPTKEMQSNMSTMTGDIRKVIELMEKHNLPEHPVPIKATIKNKSGLDITLNAYKGGNTPLPIRLTDVNGKTVVKDNFKGKVTLVNFWATWCPPCVKEIPSLNRLKAKMSGLPFELISINYAEEKETIRKFMQEVKVEFPVLLDTEGEFSKQSKVIVFPSTYVIDTNGIIRYGVNAAIEWDDPELIRTLKSLL